MPDSILVVGESSDFFEATKEALSKGRLANPVVGVEDASLAEHYIHGLAPFSDRRHHPLPAVIVVVADGDPTDAIRLLRTVRSHLVLRTVPFVVCARDLPEHESTALQTNGASAVISADIAAEVLLDIIRDANTPWFVTRRGGTA